MVNRVLEAQGCNVKFSELTKLPKTLTPLNSNVMASLNEGGMEMVVFQRCRDQGSGRTTDFKN